MDAITTHVGSQKKFSRIIFFLAKIFPRTFPILFKISERKFYLYNDHDALLFSSNRKKKINPNTFSTTASNFYFPGPTGSLIKQKYDNFESFSAPKHVFFFEKNFVFVIFFYFLNSLYFFTDFQPKIKRKKKLQLTIVPNSYQT